MVSSVRREVELYQRADDRSWTLRTFSDGRCSLSNGVVLELSVVYRNVDVSVR